MIIFKSLCSKCQKGNSKNFSIYKHFYYYFFLIQDFVQWKGISNQSEWKGRSLSGCQSVPVGSWAVRDSPPVLQGPRNMQLSCEQPCCCCWIRNNTGLSWNLCWLGPGFPQAQLRPDLPFLLPDHLCSSGESPAEPLGKTGDSGQWTFLKDLLAARDSVTLGIGLDHFRFTLASPFPMSLARKLKTLCNHFFF